MHAAYGRDFANDGGHASWHGQFPEPAAVAPVGAPSRYGARRANLPAIAAIGAGHAALLALLVSFDVIPLHRPAPRPLVVTLMPDLAPPPAFVPDKVEPPVVSPPPIVRVATPAPPPVAVVDTSPPVPTPMVVASAPSPAPAAPPAPTPAMPITPPDFTAGYLKNPAPKYPMDARRAKEQGTVRIKVLVSAQGSVDQIKVSSSSGSDRLDQAALDAVSRWSFAPAKQAGRAVAAWVIVPIPFVLKA